MAPDPRIPRPRGGPLLTAGLALTAFACGDPPPPPGAPNVLLVTIDTLRADHLKSYGYFRETAPNLTALAESGVVFRKCYAPMATTLPSHISMMTGVWPIEHGVIANLAGRHLFQRDPRLLTLAQVFDRTGYDTAAFVSASPLRESTGLVDGFDTYDPVDFTQRRADVTVDRARAWLAERGERPWFLWVHLFDPHAPYEAPDEYRGLFKADKGSKGFMKERGIPFNRESKKRNNRYDEEIAFTDHHLGRLLADMDPGVHIVVAGDHGEGLLQHGDEHHGFVWREQLRVPFLLRMPGLDPARRFELCSLVDLAATLLGVLEPWLDPGSVARFRSQESGKDLLSPDFEPRGLLGLSTAHKTVGDRRSEMSWTRARWRLIVRQGDDGTEEVELYDVSGDPHEREDLAQRHPKKVSELRAELRDAMALQNEKKGGGMREATGSELESLRALGYGD